MRSPGAVITGGIGIIFAAMGLLTFFGAQRMMRLQSYGLAVTAGILQFIPSPGSLLGLPIGIWALFVLTRQQVHVAFIEAAENKTVPTDDRTGQIALIIFALAANIIFLVGFASSLGGGRFPWFVFVFGPPLLILDAFVYKGRLNRPVFGPESLSEQLRQEISKTANLKELIDAGAPGGTRRPAVGSLVLGITSLLFTSFNMEFAGRFVFIFLPAFFSVFLGVTVIKTIQSYRDHRLDVGLAIAGIIAGLISGIGLFAGTM
jgi:hypothetical protein